MREEDGLMAGVEEEDDNGGTKKKKKKRSPRKHKHLRPHCIDDDGRIKLLKPTETAWCLVCLKSPESVEQTPKFCLEFRRRFRLPCGSFIDFLAKAKEVEDFDRWNDKVDAVGSPSPPIGLLLLGSLRHLGRGLTFDDLEECTSIDEEAHRQFFHKFVHCGANLLCPEHVMPPKAAQECELHRRKFAVGGLNGCGFSFDAASVPLWNCEHNPRHAHVGFKNSHPARTCNLSTGHRGKILHSARGHPARWNDKTVAHLDEFVRPIGEGKLPQDAAFEPLEWLGEPGASLVVTRQCRGAWGIG